MRFTVSALAVASLNAVLVAADTQAFCPSGATNICYSVSVPNSTVSSNGDGDIFLQISAPDTYQWVGLGYGSQMSGAHIFVMYQDGSGNVTISPRTGTGHVEPEYNSAAKLTLLAGSGVANGTMTANFKCSGSACGTTINPSSSSSNWISAWKSGSALNSTSLSEDIVEHDNHAQFTYDLTQAVESSDVNPFLTSASSSSTSSAPSSSPTSSSGSSQVIDNTIPNLMKAHGSIMGLTVAVLLPLGAIAVRTIGMTAHFIIQLLAFLLLWAGFGCGVVLARDTGLLFNNTHTVFGTVIVSLLVLQPLLGVLHHQQYVKTGGATVSTYAHRWFGRVLMILAIVNGGLGLYLADNTTGGKIAYAVIAGVLGAVWLALALFHEVRGGKREQPGGAKALSDSNGSPTGMSQPHA